MKYTFWIALAALAFWYYSGSDERNEKARLAKVAVENKAEAEAKEEAAHKEKSRAIHYELAEKHNALTPPEWAPRGDNNPNTSTSLDYRLVNDEGRPALIYGSVVDAYKSNGKYFLKLTEPGPPSFFMARSRFVTYIDFHLECSKEIVRKVLKPHQMGSLGVIAKFHEFKKIDYLYTGKKTDETAKIQIARSESYIANGTCIDATSWPKDKKGERTRTANEIIRDASEKFKNNQP